METDAFIDGQVASLPLLDHLVNDDDIVPVDPRLLFDGSTDEELIVPPAPEVDPEAERRHQVFLGLVNKPRWRELVDAYKRTEPLPFARRNEYTMVKAGTPVVVSAPGETPDDTEYVPDFTDTKRAAREQYWWKRYFNLPTDDQCFNKRFLPGGPDTWTDSEQWDYTDEQWVTHLAFVRDHPSIYYNTCKKVLKLWGTSILPRDSTVEDVEHEAFYIMWKTLHDDFILPEDSAPYCPLDSL